MSFYLYTYLYIYVYIGIVQELGKMGINQCLWATLCRDNQHFGSDCDAWKASATEEVTATCASTNTFVGRSRFQHVPTGCTMVTVFQVTKIQQTLVYRANSRSTEWHHLPPIPHPPPLLDEDRHGCWWLGDTETDFAYDLGNPILTMHCMYYTYFQSNKFIAL